VQVPSARPPLSISQVSTLSASFDEALIAYHTAGLDGIGIWEMKLPEGDDGTTAERLRNSGLVSTNAVPVVPSILPLHLMPGPPDPRERVERLCASIARLARFEPASVVFLTGSARGLDDARAIVVEGVKRLAEAADRAGVRIGLEPYQQVDGEPWTIVSSVADAVELLEEADATDVGITFDVWHLWNSPALYEDIAAHVDRFTAVHVSDYREPTRGWADRVLPGDGVADVPGILAALGRAGWRGPLDLEIFSDDGSFGTAYPDSLWAWKPVELAERGRAAMETAIAESAKHGEGVVAVRTRP